MLLNVLRWTYTYLTLISIQYLINYNWKFCTGFYLFITLATFIGYCQALFCFTYVPFSKCDSWFMMQGFTHPKNICAKWHLPSSCKNLICQKKKVNRNSVSSINYIESHQMNCIYIDQNHNPIASVGCTNCTVNDILCRSSIWVRKTCHIEKNNPFNEKKGRNLRNSDRGGIYSPGWKDMQYRLHAQNRTTKSQFTNCIDRIPDTRISCSFPL